MRFRFSRSRFVEQKCKFFEEKICKINELQTLVSKTVNGGYHIYYKYTNKLKPSVRLKNINDIVSIDIKTDGGCVFEGINYSLVNDYEIDNVPEQLINLYHKDKEREKIEESLGDSKLNKEGIGMLLDNLSGKYYENYQEWINVLCCLKNINCDKQIAEEFSSKSDKFNKEDFNKKWNSLDVRKKPGIGTLYFFLKESVGDERYKSLKRKLNKCINAEFEKDLTDCEALCLFKEKYQGILTADINSNLYYCNQNTGIWEQIARNRKELQDIIYDFDNFLKEKEYSYNLSTRNKRQDFIAELISSLQVKNLEFDKDPYLLAFSNGVVKLRTEILRKANPSLSTTGWNLREPR